MAKRVSVWMAASAAVLAAAGLTACGSAQPSAPAETAAVEATTTPAIGPAPAETEQASAATETAAPAAATVPASPAAAAAAPTPAPKAQVQAQVTTPPAPPAKAPAAKAAATPAPAATRAADTGEFVEGPGRAVVQASCTSCHVASQVTSVAKSQAQWAETVEKMISYGAQVSDAEFKTIVSYLSRHYGTGS